MALRVFSNKEKYYILAPKKSGIGGPRRKVIVAEFNSEADAEKFYDNNDGDSEDWTIGSESEIKKHNHNPEIKIGMTVFSMRKEFRLFSDNKITSDEEFRDYAHNVMKQAHGDNYSEETTNKVVDDLLKNNPNASYGELVGRLTSGFGKDKSFSNNDVTYKNFKIVENKHYDERKPYKFVIEADKISPVTLRRCKDKEEAENELLKLKQKYK